MPLKTVLPVDSLPAALATGRQIRVLCADDHPLVREGIRALLTDAPDLVLVSEASTGIEAIEKSLKHRPDVVLMDLKMPLMSGVEAISVIVKNAPECKVIVLTTYRGDVIAKRALKEGASGYLLKSDVRKDLLDTIRSVFAGERRVNSEVAAELSRLVNLEALSVREVSVLQQIAAGKTNRDIGASLFVTEGTVKNHVKSILSKLQASDRTQAVILGLERGILGM